jgi:hypothetical protein
MLIKNPSPGKDCLSLEALILTPEFRVLNDHQRKFVVRYVEDGLASSGYDAVAALKHAYGPVKNTEIREYHTLRNKTVKKVLDLHFRRSPLESILADLQRAARKSVKLKLGLTPATVKALAAFEAYVAAQSTVKGRDLQ